MRRTILSTAAFMLASAVACVSAGAADFRWASTTDPDTMDPHASNSAPVFSFLNNVYEGLVRRNADMKIEGSLAKSWEPIGQGEGWRFVLREGVKFHDGADLTAEDVLFSYRRASSEQADTASWFSPVSDVKVVDDLTIDFLTNEPNPLFPDSIANFLIMDSGWAKANDAETPAKDAQTFATLNANGTGPYMLLERQPGLRTTLTAFDGWWGKRSGNVTTATFTPIQNDATRVAALISGDVDLVNPVPVQDAARLDATDGVKVIRGIEARVIMFGFDQTSATLSAGEDAGKPNPFKDARVREAVARTIDVDAILQTIMRGSAEAASQLVSPAMRGYSPSLAERPSTDVEAARALLAEAGYPDGFSFGLKCPNDRYLNDEAVCQAAVSMLAKVGLKAQLDAVPVSTYWSELRADNMDMYLLGWSPGTFDAEHPIRFLAATPNEEKKLGSWNFGGYSNVRVDELLPRIQSELDETVRQAMLDEAAGLIQSEHAYVPLYVQPLVWGARENVEVVQRPDDFLILRWVTVK